MCYRLGSHDNFPVVVVVVRAARAMDNRLGGSLILALIDANNNQQMWI